MGEGVGTRNKNEEVAVSRNGRKVLHSEEVLAILQFWSMIKIESDHLIVMDHKKMEFFRVYW